MKFYSHFVVIVACIIIFSSKVSAQHTLHLCVNNVGSSNGKLMLAIYNKELGFPQEAHKAYKVQQIPATKGKVQIKLGALPKGTYAIAVFHDANNDGQLNTNMIGIPVEGFAFSNNPKPVFGAPTFNDACFQVTGTKQLELDLIY